MKSLPTRSRTASMTRMPNRSRLSEVAAVLVRATIDVLRPELVDQMAMAGHDLAAVEAAGLQTPGRGGKGLHKFINGILVQRMRVFAVIRLANVARAVHAVPQVDAPSTAAAVCDLANDRHVVACIVELNSCR